MFERCAPEAAGVKREGIEAFLQDMVDKHLHMHNLMILRHGKIIAEGDYAPWSRENLHMLFSLSKSFTSTAVGFAVQDGLLKVTDRLVDFFPELLPCAPCGNMQKITVKNMLSMNTGHGKEPQYMGDNWEEIFLRSYVPHEPGTHFLYNTAATYMLAAIVQKVTGKKLLAYLREKLMDPLGMSADIWTEESPSGVATGGYGLNVRVSDIAKLGQFYLQKGCWEGKQLLDPAWVKDAQTPWSDNSQNGAATDDWKSGYGYQFWMCQPDNVFRGDGAFGQYCIMCPDQDMVIAINSGVEDMGAVMKSLWKNVLPAVGEEPLPGADAGVMEIHGVTHARWEDMGKDVTDPKIEPAWVGSYRMQPGQMLGIEKITVDLDSVTLTIDGMDTRLPLCRETWQYVTLQHPASENKRDTYNDACAVRAARREEALVLHICVIYTPFEQIMKLTFTPHGIELKGHQNVGFRDGDYTVLGYKL